MRVVYGCVCVLVCVCAYIMCVCSYAYSGLLVCVRVCLCAGPVCFTVCVCACSLTVNLLSARWLFWVKIAMGKLAIMKSVSLTLNQARSLLHPTDVN